MPTDLNVLVMQRCALCSALSSPRKPQVMIEQRCSTENVMKVVVVVGRRAVAGDLLSRTTFRAKISTF
jgi:hypothetical protein